MSLGEGGAASVGMRRLAQRAVSAVARRGRGARPDRPVAPSRGVWHDRHLRSRRTATTSALASDDDAPSIPSLRAPFAPAGDQPTAIADCVKHLRDDNARFACLRGATGTGKTFVVANVIDTIARDKPTLVVVPNKTLAAQVARELRAYLRDTHRVELFVSHFSLYVPESFSRGRYVEKRSAVDPNLDALRHRATRALVESDNVVVVASVSCLYGMGMPADYVDARLVLEPNASHSGGRDVLGARLAEGLLYEPAGAGAGGESPGGPYDDDVVADRVMRGQWAWGPVGIRGSDVRRLVVWPPYEDSPLQFDLDKEGRLVGFARTPQGTNRDGAKRSAYVLEDICDPAPLPPPPQRVTLWPRQHHITPPERLKLATAAITRELRERCAELRANGHGMEAERLEQRTNADVALLNELGWCPGAEHYSRHLGGRAEGEPPVTLLDYLNFNTSDAPTRPGAGADARARHRGWLLVADESHVMLPQLRAMHGGDRSRKLGLVAGGYRLPSALDNRPLTFEEFWERVPQALLVSATPGDVENEWCESRMVDMVVRPSGVVDPPIKIFPRANQLPQLAAAVRERAARGEASLVCALTKADCEDLAGYLNEIGGCRADWLHSELTAPQRAEKLQALQAGDIDVLVGAQLLREGLDVPQVSLVAVLDAGVPGFMRSARSLMQMHGRAARNARGECHLFADAPFTDAINDAVAEVNRRRRKQRDFNERNGIVPVNASAGSSSSSLSLFQVMAEEIAEERAQIEESSTRSANARVAAGTRFNRGDDDVGGDAPGSSGFAPSEEEVQAALKAWRMKRNGVADAAAAAEKARANALAAREARAETAAALAGPGGTWATLGDTFTAREFTDALFDPANAPTTPSSPGFDPQVTTTRSAEDVLESFGVDASHLPSLRRKLADLPAKTGVYRWLAEDGSVLYIGKAKSLRDRTRGYLAPGLLRRSPRHRRLAGLARSVDTVLTPGGEADALALEARLIAAAKPPLNVLLKEAPKPDAALVVGLMDPVDDVLPRFFMTDAGGDRGRAFLGGAAKRVAGGNGNGNANDGDAGARSGRDRVGYDGIGGRVSPGVVAAAEAAAAAIARSRDPAPGGTSSSSSSSSSSSGGVVRAWLRPTKADARRTLGDLERALGLRSLAFRARHGDAEAAVRLREAARMAAAALDGGDAAEEAAAELEREGRFAAAASLRSAAAPGAAALGALSSLLAEEAAASGGDGGAGTAVDVVAAAAEGTCCRVQVVRIRDGTIAGMFAAAVELPDDRTGVVGAVGDDDEGTVAEWLGGDRSEEEEEEEEGDEAGALEVALGEAAQRAMEAFYGDGGGARGDPPDAILVPHALPDAPGLERIIARASTAGDDAGTSDAKGRRRRTTRTTRTLRHGSDLPEGLPAALASLAKANAAEAARRAAREAAASAAVADIVGVPGRPIRSIEGVDVSHLAGSATAASVVKFTDGAADPAGHRRYDLDVVAARPDGGGGTTGFDGDDPGAIYAAVARRCAGKRGVVDLPDLLLIDGGVAQLAAAARALSDAGVVVVNARAPDGTLVGSPEEASSNALGPARRVALASLAKGRLSGEEAVYVPAVATSISDDDDDDTLGVAPFARGAHKAWCSSAAKGKDARGGPGLELLRAVRDESHAAALGAHRRRRRSDLFREMRGQGVGDSPGPVSDSGFGSGAGAGDSSDEEEREMSALG